MEAYYDVVADGDELNRLLAVAPFTMPKVERSRPTLDAGRVWVTLLSLFSGARLNELAGLQTDDLKREGGIAYLNIVEGKTDAATRRVPLHPTLTALGFAKYAAALPRADVSRAHPQRQGRLWRPCQPMVYTAPPRHAWQGRGSDRFR